jgi:hypothetical protein
MPTVAPSVAHAALAGGDRDDVLDPRDELHAALHRVRDDLRGDVGARLRDSGQAREPLDHLGAHALQHAARRIAEDDVERDAVALDLHVLHALRLDVVAARHRVDQLAQRVEDFLLGNRHGKGSGRG